MGKTIHKLSERVSYIASSDTWMEGNALEQLEGVLRLSHIKKIVGMPDLHAGIGYPVGAAFYSENYFYPALIGGDIGCGMSLWQLDQIAARTKLDRLERRLGNIDHPLQSDEIVPYLPDELKDNPFLSSLGTIGLGNHFAEFLQCDELINSDMAAQYNVDRKSLFLLVHSGSRGFGQQVSRAHIDQYNHDGVADDDPNALEFLTGQNLALQYAKLNRELIARRIMQNVRADGVQLLDLAHNQLERIETADYNGWLHRKGAAPADGGIAIIPGSRGDYSYLVKTIESETSLFSIAHGAGRKWMRSECRGRLEKRWSADQLLRNPFNGRVICSDRALVYEEAPQAYKSIDTVIESLVNVGVIEVIARFKPMLTYKTRKEV